MNEVTTILKEIEGVLGKVDQDQLRRTAEKVLQHDRVFVVGEGRSGLMAKSFAMRLMHLGLTVYVVGETITPSIKEGDLLVAVSGSGKTKGVVWTAEQTRSLNAAVVAVTTADESPLAEAADDILLVPAATKYRKAGETETIQPLGSLFDQCVHLLFDTICLHVAHLKEVDNDKAFSQHSNLE